MSLASFLLYYLTHFGVLFCISTCSLHLCCLIAKTYRLNLRSLYRGIDWDKMITQFLEHWIPVTFDNVYFSWLLEFLSVDMTISVTLTMAIISKSCLFSFPENQLQKIEKNTEFIYESNTKSPENHSKGTVHDENYPKFKWSQEREIGQWTLFFHGGKLTFSGDFWVKSCLLWPQLLSMGAGSFFFTPLGL